MFLLAQTMNCPELLPSSSCHYVCVRNRVYFRPRREFDKRGEGCFFVRQCSCLWHRLFIYEIFSWYMALLSVAVSIQLFKA